MAYLETKLIFQGPMFPWTMILGTKSRSSWSWYPSINVIQIVHMKVSYSFLFPTPVDMRGLCAGSFAYIPSNYNIIHLYIQHAYKIHIYIYPKHTHKQIINIWPTKITLVAENNVMCHFPHSVAFHPNRVGWRNKHFDGQPNFQENGMCPKKHGRNRRFVQKKKN